MPSRHAQFYSDLVPTMVPVALPGSAIYMVCHFVVIAHGFEPFTLWGTATQGLQLLQTSLAHEKYLNEAHTQVQELEWEIDALVLERR